MAMAYRGRRSGVAGPVILILLGVLFLLSEFVPSLSIARTWPVLVIIFGVYLLLRSVSPPRAPRGPSV